MWILRPEQAVHSLADLYAAHRVLVEHPRRRHAGCSPALEQPALGHQALPLGIAVRGERDDLGAEREPPRIVARQLERLGHERGDASADVILHPVRIVP